MRVHDNIRDCCCFIYCNTNKVRELVGTGFFVGEKFSEDGPENLQYVYLITARHIIDGIKRKPDVQSIGIRLNIKNGDTIDIDVPLDGWLYHPKDKSIDAVILPAMEIIGIDVAAIPSYTTVTDETIKKYGIGIGDEVCIVGLFDQHYGIRRNLPILRIGNIAMMPQERIQTRDYGPIEAYLIELRSIGGLSGSPVFVHTRSYIKGKEKHTLFWLGLIHGHWEISQDAIDTIDTLDSSNNHQINMGIGVVIPAHKIFEITRDEDLIKAKEEGKKEFLKRYISHQ